MADDIMIQHIGVGPDGSLQIGYLKPAEDVKANGAMHMRTIVIPAGDDYDDEIEAVMDAAAYAVRDILEDWDKLSAAVPE